MARFKGKLYHNTRRMFIVLNVASSKREIQTLSTATNVSEFEMFQPNLQMRKY